MKEQSPVAGLLERWQREATELNGRYSQPALAGLTSQHIRELEDALTQEADEPLSLVEAAKVSGFSDDYLGRLVRRGTLKNVGRRGAPRVRRGDLPRKKPLQESESDATPSARRRIVLAARSN